MIDLTGSGAEADLPRCCPSPPYIAGPAHLSGDLGGAPLFSPQAIKTIRGQVQTCGVVAACWSATWSLTY